MKRRIATTLLVLVVGVASGANAQTVQELRVQWQAYVGTPPETAPGRGIASTVFTVLERRSISGTLARQRDPQLSSDQLVVRALNVRGEIIDTQLIPDPRVLRAEATGPTGELSGQVLHRATPEFLLTLPDNAAISELRVYHPRWTGTAFVLDLMGTITFN
jgi:hypothetical protein